MLFQGDIIIKQAVELALEDIKKNLWLIDDIFSDLVTNPLLKQKYGLKEIQRCKEFFTNNEVNIYMQHRIDTEQFHCITIALGSSVEDDSLATLGDLSPEVDELEPGQIGRPIQYFVSPFNVVSYDKETGIIEAPEDLEDIKYVSKDMIAIDPKTGNGFIIIEGQVGNNGFKITPDSNLTCGKLAIIPKYQIYRARRERAISKESYNIGVHCHGDPSTLIFLFGIVKYALFRYREVLLERENLQLSRVSCTDMIKNNHFKTENVFSRFITIKGQVEESWLKTPYRVIEAVDLEDTGEEYTQGIKIISQKAPDELDTSEDLWVTIDEEDDNNIEE